MESSAIDDPVRCILMLDIIDCDHQTTGFGQGLHQSISPRQHSLLGFSGADQPCSNNQYLAQISQAAKPAVQLLSACIWVD
jgi:hypothetical protein